MISQRQTDQGIYIPHPAPNAVVKEDPHTMGLWSVIKTLIVPAIISLILYIIITYVAVPVWKRYRGRYSQYLPLDTISTQTTSLRERLQSAIARWLVPSSWRPTPPYTMNADGTQHRVGSIDFDEDDGEELFEVESNRREAISLDARRGGVEDGSRLSRDLEEGFKDDSDDEEVQSGRAQAR